MIWLYTLDYESGEYEEAARVENGEVVSGDGAIVRMAFPDEIPTDPQAFINAYNSASVMASTDEDVEQPQPSEEQQEVAMADGDSGNSNLAGEHTPEWDRHYLRMLEGTAWGESDRALLAGSGVPEMVQDRLRESIMEGHIFGDIEAIPSSERMQLREFMTETLVDSDGWSTDGLADQLMQLEGVNDRDKAETIARTETASVVNAAREDAYEDRGLGDAKFKWVGVSDNRTTEACTWLKEQTNPKFGGDPVTLERLRELVEEAPSHDPDMQDDLARPESYTVHINERHTYTRHVE